MIDTKYRSPYQTWIIDPLLKSPLAQLNPQWVTLFAALSGLTIPYLLYLHLPLIALCALGFSGFCDTFDGSLARHQNNPTPKGAVLDITSDRLVECAIILGLYLFNPTARALPCLLMLAASFLCVTTFLVVGIFNANNSQKSFYYSPGLMERAEAFIFFALMIGFPSSFQILAGAYILLVTLTAIIRCAQFIAIAI